MELHKQIKLDKTKYNLSLQDDPLVFFAKALDFVMENYKDDFDRIANTKFENVSEEFFLREYIWCVCVSGFNARIVSGFFTRLLSAYQPLFDFVKGKIDDVNSLGMATNAMEVFGNSRKTKAIINTAFTIRDSIDKHGWKIYRNNELNTPQKLEKFDMVGPVISMHLARNCGLLNYVKPDLWLVRMTKTWGFANPIELCKHIQQKYDLPLGLIDLCLFYAASSFKTKE